MEIESQLMAGEVWKNSYVSHYSIKTKWLSPFIQYAQKVTKMPKKRFTSDQYQSNKMFHFQISFKFWISMFKLVKNDLMNTQLSSLKCLSFEVWIACEQSYQWLIFNFKWNSFTVYKILTTIA